MCVRCVPRSASAKKVRWAVPHHSRTCTSSLASGARGMSAARPLPLPRNPLPGMDPLEMSTPGPALDATSATCKRTARKGGSADGVQQNADTSGQHWAGESPHDEHRALTSGTQKNKAATFAWTHTHKGTHVQGPQTDPNITTRHHTSPHVTTHHHTPRPSHASLSLQRAVSNTAAQRTTGDGSSSSALARAQLSDSTA